MGNRSENNLNNTKLIEGYERMSDEEINRKLIEKANNMEVVIDKSE